MTNYILERGKFMKRVISFMLASLIMLFSVVLVSAETDIVTNANSLTRQCRMFYAQYISGGSVPNQGPYYSDSSVAKMRQIIQENRALIDRAEDGEEIPGEMFQAGYDRMVEVSKEMYIHEKELKLILEMNKSQKNTDNYFDEEMWQEYQSAIVEAEKALESGDEVTIDEHYYKMLAQHNRLCIYNPVVGDVNGDGIFNVVDVTYFQKKLTEGADELNYSQRLVSSVEYDDGELYPRITNATSMQKLLAGLVEVREYYPIDQYIALINTSSDTYRRGTFYNNALWTRYHEENQWLNGE